MLQHGYTFNNMPKETTFNLYCFILFKQVIKMYKLEPHQICDIVFLIFKSVKISERNKYSKSNPVNFEKLFNT